MFFAYVPSEGFSILGLLDKAKDYILNLIPQISILFPVLEREDGNYDEKAFADCVRTMAKSSHLVGAKRDYANEEKTRGLLILALNSYAGFLFISQFAISNQNDKAKINQQIRMAQFLLSKLNNSDEWDELAEAIWGSP